MSTTQSTDASGAEVAEEQCVHPVEGSTSEDYGGSSDNSKLSLSVDEGRSWIEAVCGFRELQAYRQRTDNSPRFTHEKAEARIGKCYGVERHAIERDAPLTTVWLSLVAPEKTPEGDWIHPEEHYNSFREGWDTTMRNLRRTLEEYEYAGVWLQSARETGYPHRHVALWILGKPEESDFHGVVDSFVRNTPHATEDANPYGEAIKLRRGYSFRQYSPEGGRVELDEQRGTVGALPREIASNVDYHANHARVDEDEREGDVRDTDPLEGEPSPEMLHASLTFEKDGKAWQPLGAFEEWAVEGAEDYGGSSDTEQPPHSSEPDTSGEDRDTEDVNPTPNTGRGPRSGENRTVIDVETDPPGSLGIG